MKFLVALVCIVGCCSAQFLAGGISDADIHDTDIQGYAKDFLAQYAGTNGERYNTVTVLKARQQVVSGMNYWLTLRISNAHSTEICEVKMYVQSWTHTKQMGSQMCHPAATRVGGYRNHVVDGKIREIASFAVSTMNFDTGVSNNVVEVTHAMTQVVSGMNYKLTLKLSDGKMCTVVVYDQSWTHTRRVSSNSCVHTRRQSGMVGAPVHMDNADSDPRVQAILSQAVKQANGMSNDMLAFMPVNIDHVTKHVVAGILYEFDLHMAESTCRNNGMGHTHTDCPMKSGGMAQTFHVTGLWQAWMDPQYTVTVKVVRS